MQECADAGRPEDWRVRRRYRPKDPPKLPVKGFNKVRGHSETIEWEAPQRGGKQCLLIEVKPKVNPKEPEAARSTGCSWRSTARRCVCVRGSLVRVDAWVKTTWREWLAATGCCSTTRSVVSLCGARHEPAARWRRFAVPQGAGVGASERDAGDVGDRHGVF